MPNIEHFNDLSDEMKSNLLHYIDRKFSMRKTINKKHTAYGLKQPFTREFGTAEEHVTSQCFKEAMEYAGYSSQPTGATVPNWHFNINLLKTT